MPPKVQSIPQGCHTLTPHLVVRDASLAIEFYKLAFGAEERRRMPGPGGKGVLHAELQIGDSVLFLCDEFELSSTRAPFSLKGTTVTIHLYVSDADVAYNRAIAAGAKVTLPIADMFWGDRFAKLTDPFGHEWSIATHKEDLTPEETERRARAVFEPVVRL